jgi:hypothetical protein
MAFLSGCHFLTVWYCKFVQIRKAVPAGYKTSTILYHGKSGVNNAMSSFGDAMRGRYGTNFYSCQHVSL